MTRFLLATDSVHTTAAACDYLAGRLTESDSVTVLPVEAGDGEGRDAEDALNVAAVRLSALAPVETTSAEGDAPAAILDAASDGDVDEIVIGVRDGAPGTDVGLGQATREVVVGSDVPVVVVPLPRLD